MTNVPKNQKSIKAHRFLRLCLILVVTLTPGITDSFAQSNHHLDKKYSFSFDSLHFSKLFDSLEVRYGISFSYDASLVPGDSLILAEAESVKLDEWLYSVLENEDLEVHEMGNQIIISSEPAKVSHQSINIEGIVIDSLNSEPMSMVNVGVEGKAIGTATNKNGHFSLFLPIEYVGEKLVFSNLGYLREFITIPSRDTTLSVQLRDTSVRLPEVLVKHVKPDEIMKEVNRRKSSNYSSDPLILTAFFRETIEQDDQYVDVSEAVIEIAKPSYSREFAQERVRFVRGRKGEFSGEMEAINFKLQGGPFLFSRVDIVREGGFLPDERGNSKYDYTYEGLDYEHGRNVFIIGFSPHIDTGELLYEGELRIDTESFAVVGATFEMTRKTIRKGREYLIRRDSRRYRTTPRFARYLIDYRPWNDKWVLNRVRGEVSMNIVDREKRVRTVFRTVSEMLVTGLRPGDRKEFRWSESFKADYILSDKIEAYDSGFWSHYNIISPDESIEKIFQSKNNSPASADGQQ